MKDLLCISLFIATICGCSSKMTAPTAVKQTSGNPVFHGWYADPEGAIINNHFVKFQTSA